MKEIWDERYNAEHYVYGKEPNEFFKEQLDRLSPGKLLMPAEGEGRNAVYAATRDWSVDAFDYSDSGYRKAMSLASEMGVQINYEITHYDSFHFKRSFYDAAGLIYFHLPGQYRTLLHQKIIDALIPGGIIILEAFHTTQLGKNTGGPQSLDFLFDEKKLREDFGGIQIKHLEVLTKSLDEGLFHNGDSRVIRCIAIKN